MSLPLPDDQDRIDHEASSWLVRIEESGLDREGHADFDAWLTADPRHEATYIEMRRTWHDLPELNDLAHLIEVPDATHEPEVARRRWRLPALAGLGAVAAGLVAIVTVPNMMPASQPEYRTEVAQTRIVTLPDGSSVTLGAKSSISLEFSDTERRVVLAGGEAFFDVVHDTSRPFLVEAGNSIVRDIGTKFDVNLSSGTVRVSVLEGLVEVSRLPVSNVAAVKPQLLRAGQRTEVVLAVASIPAAPAVVAPPPIVALPAQAPAAWREGRFVFDNVRLADLAADVSRYYAPGVRLASPEVADLRVTASFKTNEIPAFMGALSATLPVKADRESNGSFTVSDARH